MLTLFKKKKSNLTRNCLDWQNSKQCSWIVDEKRPWNLIKIGLGLLSEKKPLPLGFWAWFQSKIYDHAMTVLIWSNCFEIPFFVLERKKKLSRSWIMINGLNSACGAQVHARVLKDGICYCTDYWVSYHYRVPDRSRKSKVVWSIATRHAMIEQVFL